ncbi:MAG: type II toxin-antitoxin system VapC family toxin [Promicromonosporaceae bacterium]|nr:type II toxin-antitoxin system VapC family toxin [Promicromonosporaceae bacterium]
MSDLYVDSSVILRALLGQSPATRQWFEGLRSSHVTLLTSRLGEVEVRRVAQNAGTPKNEVDDYLDRFALILVDDQLLNEAIAIPFPLGGADSIHVATALRFGPTALEIVTHDAQMAAACQALGFHVSDPVTDDPNRAPVAGLALGP